MRNAIVTIATTLLACLSFGAAAEDGQDELGNWLIWNGALRYSDRWGVFTEAQLRLWELASNPSEFFVHAAGQYHTSENTLLSLGYIRAATELFEDSGETATENRIYQQFTGTHTWGRPILQHRLRTEQRWLEESDETVFRNRFRYRLQVTVPLQGSTIEAGKPFLNFYDEIFLNFGNRIETFDQNRLYGAYGWQFSKQANLQLGLLWQHRSSQRDFYRLQIFYTHNFDFR